MLICWNDIKIHLGFEDSYFVPPPIYNLTIEMLTATFCRAALSHMFVIRPNIADLGFSQVFAKGRTTSTLQV